MAEDYRPEMKKMKLDSESSTSTSPILPSSQTACSQDASQNLFMDTSLCNFSDIRKFPGFVDKSLLIKAVLDNESNILLIAPRRFGKTANLTMLKQFFEVAPDQKTKDESRKLFEDLLINKYESLMDNNFGAYPIILLDFKCLGPISSFDAVFEKVRSITHELYASHEYLLASDKLKDSEKLFIKRWCDLTVFETIANTADQIFLALKYMAQFLYRHYDRKVIVLIDEYDNICTDSIRYVNDDIDKNFKAECEIDKIIALCIGCVACLLKGNQYVCRGIMTGISTLASMGLSKLGNVKVMKFQEENPFSKFYGLTQEELGALMKLNSKFDCEQIKLFYNGYRNDVLNIFSVMNYCNSLKLENYWRESGIVENLDKTLRIPVVRSMVNKLLSDLSNEIEINYLSKIEPKNICDLKNVLEAKDLNVNGVTIFLNFLLEQGYLKIVQLDKANEKCTIKIPNYEIKNEFRQKLMLFYEIDCKVDISAVKICATLFDELNQSDDNNKNIFPEICNLLNKIINPIEFGVKNEATLHHIIFLVVFFSSNFKSFSEMRTAVKNFKRLDLLMLSSILGVIIELKYDKDAMLALTQIKNNNYDKAFANVEYNPTNIDVKYRLYVGLNMSRDQKITLSVLFNSLNFYERVNYS